LYKRIIEGGKAHHQTPKDDTMNTTNAKATVKNVTLISGTGLISWTDDYFGSTVRSFKAFDALVRTMIAERDDAMTAYEKFDFSIKWSDGDIYDGCLVVNKEMAAESHILASHINASLARHSDREEAEAFEAGHRIG
jgi:hypothetical protein